MLGAPRKPLLPLLPLLWSLTASPCPANEADDSVAPVVPESARSRARKQFLDARRAHEAGDYERAARGFEAAHRTLPHASTQFNAGIAWDLAGDTARAADAYEAALEMGGLEEEEAAEARARLSSLKKTLGYLRILEPAGAFVSAAHLEGATVPARLHVRPGRYRIQLESPTGRERASESVSVGAGEVVNVRISLGVASAPPAKPEPLPKRDERAQETADGDAQRVWGWVALGGGVLLTGTAIFLGINALSARDTFNESGRTDLDARARAATLRTWTNVAWGGAALSGIGGLYLVLSAPTVRF